MEFRGGRIWSLWFKSHENWLYLSSFTRLEEQEEKKGWEHKKM